MNTLEKKVYAIYKDLAVNFDIDSIMSLYFELGDLFDRTDVYDSYNGYIVDHIKDCIADDLKDNKISEESMPDYIIKLKNQLSDTVHETISKMIMENTRDDLNRIHEKNHVYVDLPVVYIP